MTRLLEKYSEDISYVITSTEAHTADQNARQKVASIMSVALSRMKKSKDPKETGIYKYSTMVKNCKTWEAFEEGCRNIFPLKKPHNLIEQMNKHFDWKIKFVIPPKPVKKNKKPDKLDLRIRDIEIRVEKIEEIFDKGFKLLVVPIGLVKGE